MLMTHSDRPARLHYMANGFRVLSPGDHVLCGRTGARVPLAELRYWSVARQEAYVDCAASLKRELACNPKLAAIAAGPTADPDRGCARVDAAIWPSQS